MVSLKSGHRKYDIHECAQIDRNVELLHQVHVNLAKHVELCITNCEDHIEDVINVPKK